MQQQQHQYLLNKTDTVLTFKNGYVKIPPGGFKKLTAKEAEHDEYILAVDRALAELTTEEPDRPETPTFDPQVLASIEPNSGMSEEQFAAYKLAKQEKPEDNGVTVTSIGKPSKDVTEEPDAKTEKSSRAKKA